MTETFLLHVKVSPAQPFLESKKTSKEKITLDLVLTELESVMISSNEQQKMFRKKYKPF